METKTRVFKIIETTIPYVFSAVLSYGVARTLNVTPFVIDSIKENAKITKEINIDENTDCSEQCRVFSDNTTIKQVTISQIGNWDSNNDGTYTRTIKIYDAEELKEKINQVEFNSIQVNSLDSVFGEPILEKTERKNSLTEEDKNTAHNLKATIYYEDENKSIITKESTSKNIHSTIAYIFITIGLGSFLEGRLREYKEHSDYKRKYKIKLNDYK